MSEQHIHVRDEPSGIAVAVQAPASSASVTIVCVVWQCTGEQLGSDEHARWFTATACHTVAPSPQVSPWRKTRNSCNVGCLDWCGQGQQWQLLRIIEGARRPLSLLRVDFELW